MPEPTGGVDRADQVAIARHWLLGHGVEVQPSEVCEPAGSRVSDGSGERRQPRPRAAGRARRSTEPAVDRSADAGAGPDVGPDADPEDVARQIVLRKLAAQARTRTELERALQERSVPVQAGATVLDRMKELGLVDDAAFARDWVASRQQRRHLSRSALRRELQAKGVDRDDIDQALEPVDVGDEYAAALDLARRRARSLTGLPREVRYRRLAGVLARRGFGSGVAGRVLSEVVGRTHDEHGTDV